MQAQMSRKYRNGGRGCGFIQIVQERVRRRSPVNTATNLWVPWNQEISRSCDVETWDYILKEDGACRGQVYLYGKHKTSYKMKISHLSTAIATRWRIEAVQHSTSLEVHMSHSSGPRIHPLLIWNHKKEDMSIFELHMSSRLSYCTWLLGDWGRRDAGRSAFSYCGDFT